jgi:ribosomal protein L16 Arg81 hydroxylase
MELHNFDRTAFLRDSWQRKPLLIRQALPGWRGPLEPDELAGLACEDDVEARLVVGANRGPGRSNTGRSPKRASASLATATGRCWCRRSITMSPKSPR